MGKLIFGDRISSFSPHTQGMHPHPILPTPSTPRPHPTDLVFSSGLNFFFLTKCPIYKLAQSVDISVMVRSAQCMFYLN